MSGRGVILYGPPASGKTTITSHLERRHPDRLALFRPLKCRAAAGNTDGYRMVDPDELERRDAAGDLIAQWSKYQAIYAIDRTALTQHLAAGTPILNLGSPGIVRAVEDATPETRWLTVALWCPRELVEQRVTARGGTDVEARLRAWDRTPWLPADLEIDTATTPVDTAADTILAALATPDPRDGRA